MTRLSITPPNGAATVELETDRVGLDLLSFLEELPFAYGSVRGGAETGPGFGAGHFLFGSMCAFKGGGHEAMVSRRWLEFGPWRLLRGRNDLSFVQFHDLQAGEATAIEQAGPGHRWMARGFFGLSTSWDNLKGQYEPNTETLIRVIAGRIVGEEEMFEAALIKARQPLVKRVRQVAYVFIDEKEARAHVHQLWLRGLEVRTFIGGREIRIDEDYQAQPVVPDWVKKIQDREGR